MTRLIAKEPFDLSLSLRAATSFSEKTTSRPEDVFHIQTRINQKPTIISVRQEKKHPPILDISCPSAVLTQATRIAAYVLNVDFDIKPFYRIAARHEKFCTVVRKLRGLRPFRPASLFEMVVTAITEQQISLRVAYSMRKKIAARFGDDVEGIQIFPDECRLARASLQELLSCGLSHRKAEYILDLSKQLSSRDLDLEKLKLMNDETAREAMMQIRGIGPWTAEYVLVRGLGRPDRVPIEDLGIRDVVGKYLGNGRRVQPSRVLELLEPFAPFRGLAAYYLLVYHRLSLT